MLILSSEQERQLRAALDAALSNLAGIKQPVQDHKPELASPSLGALWTRRKAHKRPHVLVVEDDEFIRTLAQQSLAGGCRAQAVETAYGALLAYPSLMPDIVFLDIELPDGSGFDVLSRLLALDPEAYVIMFSSNSDQPHIAQAMKAGARGFVGKPFTRQKLMEYLASSPHVRERQHA